MTAFRRQWIAGLASGVGSFMHSLAATWTIVHDLGAGRHLGILYAATTVPSVMFAVAAGTVSDRSDRRRLALTTQVAAAAIAASTAGLAATGLITTPLLLAAAFLLATTGAFAAPAFLTAVADLVPPGLVAPSITLNMLSGFVAQAVGPMLAGVLLASTGPASAFAVNAVSFVIVAAVVATWTTHIRQERVGASSRPADGFRSILRSATLTHLTARMAAIMGITPAISVTVPTLLTQRFDASSSTLGVTTGCLGLGALMAWATSHKRPGTATRTQLLATTAWAAGAVVIAATDRLVVCMIAVTLVGAATFTATTTTMAGFQTAIDPTLRGRASAALGLCGWTSATLAALLWSYIATSHGVGTALITAAGMHIASTVALATLPHRLAAPTK